MRASVLLQKAHGRDQLLWPRCKCSRPKPRATDVFEEFDLLAEPLEGLVVLSLDVVCSAICGVAIRRGAVVHGQRGRGPVPEQGRAVRVAV